MANQNPNQNQGGQRQGGGQQADNQGGTPRPDKNGQGDTRKAGQPDEKSGSQNGR